MIFAEVTEVVAGTVSSCVVHPFDEAALTIPATVDRFGTGCVVLTCPLRAGTCGDVVSTMHASMLRRHWGYRTLGGRRYGLEEFVPIRVECSLQQHPQLHLAMVALAAGEERLVGVTEMADIPQRRAGRLAACVGPQVSGALSPEWLEHHEQLGVERFFSFVPTGKEYTDGKYNINGDIPENILDYLHWSGTFPPEAVALAPRATVEYMLYSPPAGTYYFGQYAMMHACWYKQRHAYDFIMYVDTDEFIWLEAAAMTAPKPLHALLARLPDTTAALHMWRWTYPPSCQPGDSSVPLVQRAVLHVPEHHFLPKVILRPRDVRNGTNHWPQVVREGMRKSVEMPDRAKIKHLRESGKRYIEQVACSGLITDEERWRSRAPLLTPL